jgi:tripartite-type tricarboxylate transporter receptor subunit TctC
MKLARRKFLRLAGGAVALPAISRVARAQTYPTRPVRLIVGYPAGGVADVVARLISQWLSERLGQPFVIENRPGAGTNIAAEAVVRAPADGYTFFLPTAANAINATLYDKLNFNFLRDIAPVAGINRFPIVMVVNSSFPVKTVPEFVAYAKANPGKINMASIGMIHVPYRGGGAALTDLLSGQVQVFFPAVSGYIEHIRAGRLRALAVMTTARLEVLPGIPAMSDFVPGLEASDWTGLGAPKNTPAEIVEKLNKEINAGLADPQLKVRIADLGGAVLGGSPAKFGGFIAEETEKWAKVIRAVNIRAE